MTIQALLRSLPKVVDDQYDRVSRKGTSARISGLYFVRSRRLSNSLIEGNRQSDRPASASDRA
jgi:hypothetical protein